MVVIGAHGGACFAIGMVHAQIARVGPVAAVVDRPSRHSRPTARPNAPRLMIH